MAPNQYLLAADNNPALLPLLRDHPGLASQRDEHGYSLVHAAASYNHLDLLRTLIQEFKVDVNIRDEDDETALFVVETVEAARVLVEELGADVSATGIDGVTARERIEAEADYPNVAAYLKSIETEVIATQMPNAVTGIMAETAAPLMDLPPVPEGLAVTIGTIDQAQEVPEEVDSELKRRIEQLAQREDFHTAEGQAELRLLVEEAISGQRLAEERNIRPRQG